MVEPSRIGPPTWKRRASFRHRQKRHLQYEVIVAVRLNGPGPDVDETERMDYELEDYFGFRWWPRAEVEGSSERFYPGQLPTLIGLCCVAKRSTSLSSSGPRTSPQLPGRATHLGAAFPLR